MLELRPNCERCDCDLPPDSGAARICSYECTFCATCADEILQGVCPNCGGGFEPRPIRPRAAWRGGTGLANDPPSTTRRTLRYTPAEVEDLVVRLRDIPPQAR